MTVEIVPLSREQLARHTEEVLDVYAEAMEVSAASARGRRGILASHLDREGLRAQVARDGQRLVGLAYGYLGRPGQWWHDQVRAALTPGQTEEWLSDAFEVCELHVRPALQGSGLGRDLLVTLLSDVPARTAVLTTPDADTRARRFYRAGGWVDLRQGLHFPGDPRVFAVLGLRLQPKSAEPGGVPRSA
jgi:ribosomal protein S18 acetylase RimI-like enzyme